MQLDDSEFNQIRSLIHDEVHAINSVSKSDDLTYVTVSKDKNILFTIFQSQYVGSMNSIFSYQRMNERITKSVPLFERDRYYKLNDVCLACLIKNASVIPEYEKLIKLHNFSFTDVFNSVLDTLFSDYKSNQSSYIKFTEVL